jgi:competence protein ComEC
MPRRLSFTRLSLNEQPLVFIALAFILGEWLAAKCPISYKLSLSAASAAWLVALGCLWLRRHVVASAALLLGFCACGAGLWALNEAGVGPERVRRLIANKVLTPDEPVELRGVLDAAPELAPERIYLSVAVERVATLGKSYAASGTVQLTVSFLNDDAARAEYDALRIDYGSRVRVLAYLRNAHGYRNPGALNFDEMLEHRGYDAFGAIKSPLLIENLGDGPRSPVLAWLYDLRARGVAAFRHDFPQPTQGVLIAVLFGNQHFLPYEVAENFRASGTFHLLVISGLHVALIVAVALALVGPLTAWLVDSRALRFVLVSALLWAYALMVGAQPAITRSTVMLTVVLCARLIFRAAPGANTLAAAALALLVWQPRDLFNPSLGLSFSTVCATAAIAAPLVTRLQHVGRWRPTAMTPYPPRVPGWIKWCAEVLFWNEAEFRAEMKREAIHYRLEKAGAARWLSTFGPTQLILDIPAIRRLSRTPVFTRWQKSWLVVRWRESRVGQWWRDARLGRAVQWGLAWSLIAVLTTACVQVGLLPMMIVQFHRFSLISPPANVIEGALMFALMLAGGAYLLLRTAVTLALPTTFAAKVMVKLAWLVNSLGEITTSAADPLRRLPHASWRVPDFGEHSWLMYGCYFALLTALIYALDVWNPLQLRAAADSLGLSKLKKTVVGIAAVSLFALAALLVWHPSPHQYERGRLSVTFLDVGQGDAMLVSFPEGRLMLLDSGGQPSFTMRDADDMPETFIEDRPGVGEMAVAPYLWHRGIKRLDMIAASHTHPDHVGGFADILRSFAVNDAVTGVPANDDTHFKDFKRAVEAAGVRLRSRAEF